MISTHKDLIVWQKSLFLVKRIYQETKSFPREELMGITSQMRRAAVSIPSNIAEGFGRSSDKELLHFLFISLGSASELDTQLLICRDLALMQECVYIELNSLNMEIIRMLASLINTKKGYVRK